MGNETISCGLLVLSTNGRDTEEREEREDEYFTITQQSLVCFVRMDTICIERNNN